MKVMFAYSTYHKYLKKPPRSLLSLNTLAKAIKPFPTNANFREYTARSPFLFIYKLSYTFIFPSGEW